MDRDILRLCMTHPSHFRRHLRVDTGSGSRPLDEICDPWQRDDFEALDPGWATVAGQNPLPVGTSADRNPSGQTDASQTSSSPIYLRGFLERPRGHSKTGDLAAMVAWVLFASRGRIVGNAIAADREQARLLRSAVQTLCVLNPWLRDYLDPMRDRIANPHTGSELTILSSDAPSVFGQTPAFVICDELVHWASEDLWTATFSAAAKRPGCMVVTITNAGLAQGKSWQWRVREYARAAKDWYFSRVDGPKASWISQSQLAEQRALLPPAAYKRLWLNQWTSEEGDALPIDDIEAACVLGGPEGMPCPDGFYLGAIDLGVKRDHSAFVMVHAKPGSRTVRLAAVKSWRPGPDGKVDLIEVRDEVLRYHEKYDLSWVGYDPHQAALMAQELEAAGVPMCEVPFSGPRLHTMAATLLGAFRGRQVQLFREPELIEDLQKLVIVERRFGFRLDAPSDLTGGHADRAIALGIVLPEASEIAMAEAEWFAEPPEPSGPFVIVTD